MTDEIKLAQATTRASRAQSLLNDELLKEAFDLLDAAYVKKWRETDARDDDARHKLWQAVNVLGKVRDHLSSVMTNGKVAQYEIDALAERRKRFGVF